MKHEIGLGSKQGTNFDVSYNTAVGILGTPYVYGEHITVLPNDHGTVEKYILAASRAAREGAAA